MSQEPTNPKSKFEEQAEAVLNAAIETFGRARVRAGELAHENRAKIDEALEKAGQVVDEKTGGKYHDAVEKVKAQAAKGVDLVEGEYAAGPASQPSQKPAGAPMASPIPPYTPPPGAPNPSPPVAADAPPTGTSGDTPTL